MPSWMAPFKAEDVVCQRQGVGEVNFKPPFLIWKSDLEVNGKSDSQNVNTAYLLVCSFT